MRKIGITGGIGSGKSLVAKVFTTLQIPVYDADSNAKRLMIESSALIAQIKNIFGNEAYLNDGSLNRTHIGSLVFTNTLLLQRLNQVVHPTVYEDFEKWSLQQNSPYVIKEAALLFESNAYQQCDEIILVTATIDTRIHRVMKRDSLTEVQVRERISKQLPENKKMKLAHHCIFNQNEAEVLPQIYQLHLQFMDAANQF